MPMSFPDFESLKIRAAMRGFRQPMAGETEDDYRQRLADHVEGSDIVEAMEIRAKVGWDQFSDGTNTEMVMRALMRSGK